MALKRLFSLGMVIVMLMPTIVVASGMPVNCQWSGGPEEVKGEWFIAVQWSEDAEKKCNKINPLFTKYAVLTSDGERITVPFSQKSYKWSNQKEAKTYLVGCSTEDGNAIDFSESCIANLSFNPVMEGGERNE